MLSKKSNHYLIITSIILSGLGIIYLCYAKKNNKSNKKNNNETIINNQIHNKSIINKDTIFENYHDINLQTQLVPKKLETSDIFSTDIFNDPITFYTNQPKNDTNINLNNQKYLSNENENPIHNRTILSTLLYKPESLVITNSNKIYNKTDSDPINTKSSKDISNVSITHLDRAYALSELGAFAPMPTSLACSYFAKGKSERSETIDNNLCRSVPTLPMATQNAQIGCSPYQDIKSTENILLSGQSDLDSKHNDNENIFECSKSNDSYIENLQLSTKIDNKESSPKSIRKYFFFSFFKNSETSSSTTSNHDDENKKNINSDVNEKINNQMEDNLDNHLSVKEVESNNNKSWLYFWWDN